MSEWKECKLGDVGILQRGRSRHRPRYAYHLYGGNIPFIQTGEIREAKKYIKTYTQTYSDAGLAQSKLWPVGTVCITIAANIAEIAILAIEACFPDSVLGFIPDEKKTNLDFIYYTLIHFQKELKHIGEGSVQDNINLGTFENILFPIPPLAEQKAIAGVLSALDDKIDLLHRQNKTLEAMAEALFRQWFVEPFDSAQGSGAEESWEEKTIGDVAIISAGGDKPEVYSEIPTASCNIPIYSNGIEKEGLYGYTNVARIYEESITISARGTIGFINLRNSPYFPIVRLVSVIPNTNIISDKFLYLWAKTQFISGTGTTQQQLTVPDFSRTQIKVPSFELVSQFTNMVNPYFSKKNNNNLQIRSLEKLRDTLLPKLMSGEVRVEV